MEQYQLYLVLAPLAALLTLGAFVLSLLQHKGKKSFWLEAFLVCATMILALSFCEFLSRQEAAILSFSHFTYGFLAFGPAFWFLFAYEYGTGRSARLRSSLALVFIVPAATSTFAFVDESQHLIWEKRCLVDIGALRINTVLRYGPWFWVHSVYSYLLFLVGAIIILREFIDHYEVYRRQALLVIGGTAVPLVMNVLYICRIVPGLYRDFSPLALALSGILFSISIVKYGLLDLNPPPRQQWANLIEDGVLIINVEGRVVDANIPASKLLGIPVEELIGSAITRTLPEYPEAEGADAAVESRALPIAFSVRPLSGKGQNDGGACITLRSRSCPSMDRWQQPAGESQAGKERLVAELSPRELEVAKLLATGLSIKQIGASLYISPNTVKTHERHIMKKLETTDRRELSPFISLFSSRMKSVNLGR